MNLTDLPDSHPVYIDGVGMATVGEIRGEPARYITTKEAARLFSYAPDTWTRWAAEGAIEGAYRDRMWRLPLTAVEAHVRRLAIPPRRRNRAPWSKTPQTGPARASSLPKG